MAVAFALGIWVAMKRAEAKGVGSKFAMDLSILILIFSLLGARFTYVVTHLEEFSEHPFDAISPIQHSGRIGIAGLVLLGGVIAGFATAYIYSRRKSVPFLTITDIFVPSLALGIAIGRLGCFFNGCCFGLETHLPWGIVFPSDCLAGDVLPGVAVHPTQLYEAGYMLAVFGGLLAYDKPALPMGKLTGIFLLLNGVGRYLNEQIRWYESGMVLLQTGNFRLTFSQLLSIGLVVIGIVLILRGGSVQAAVDSAGTGTVKRSNRSRS